MSQAQEYAKYCNETWSAEFEKKKLLPSSAGPEPTKQIAIITCMDARLDVFSMFGLELAESHVIRVGGGRVADAMRSLVASEQILQTTEIMVVHHTDCGFMKPKTLDQVYEETSEGLGHSTDHIAFMPILRGLAHSVREDCQYLRESRDVKKSATISGWIYNTFNGKIEQIV